MATKKELLEAQGFSRKRLLSAFIGGAPGGKELEPAQPLRAVIAGVVLTAMLILGGVFYGLIRPGLPTDWENNRLILASDTGARYVSIDGVLYPVINTASARLLIEPSEFGIITTDQATLEGIEIGATIGILGAPDALPNSEQLINAGWSACTRDAQSSLAISTQIQAIATSDATVVRLADTLYVISDGRRYAVDSAQEDSILRAVQLNSITPEDVDGNWLNLFSQGTELAPIFVRNAGESLGNSNLVIGSVVQAEGSSETELFLIGEDGTLAELSPLAFRLYMLGTGSELGGAQQVSPSELASLSNAPARAGGSDWPVDSLTPLVTNDATCALLTHVDGTPRTVLGTLRDDSEVDESTVGVRVERGHGSLVYIGEGTSALSYLIDESGTAYAIPGATEDVLNRLGFDITDMQQVTAPWLDFMAAGPALDKEAARRTPESQTTAG